MLEKQNKRLVISLVVLTAAITAFVFLDRDKQDFAVDKNLYSNIDLKSVDRVLIESPSGKSDLRYQGYRWKVNDSIDADRGLVEVLFATLQQAQPKRPVAESLQDSVAGVLRKSGVKVSLFAGNEKLKSFYAGGNEQKTQAIFIPEAGGEPHLMIIPGYRVYVAGIFEIPPVAWKEKLIFNFNWQNFAKLEARYKNSSGDFDIMMDRGQVSIAQVPEADTAKLNSYLDQISLLTVDEYINRNRMTDSLTGTSPLVNVTVSDIANRKYQLSIFASGDRFYGKIDQKWWAILNENRVIPLLRPKDFFIKR
jgi:hypothetical protein